MTTRRTMLAAITGAVLTPAVFGGQAASTTTLILIRHAEKQDGRDPDLSERGRERAEVLAGLLQAAGVTRIFATEYKRTQQTVAPLAAAQGVEVESYAAREPGAFADAMSEDGGGVVVAAGHSNTVPAIARALGVELRDLDDRGFFDESEYERVVILTLHAAGDGPMRAISTLELRMTLEDD